MTSQTGPNFETYTGNDTSQTRNERERNYQSFLAMCGQPNPRKKPHRNLQRAEQSQRSNSQYSLMGERSNVARLAEVRFLVLAVECNVKVSYVALTHTIWVRVPAL